MDEQSVKAVEDVETRSEKWSILSTHVTPLLKYFAMVLVMVVVAVGLWLVIASGLNKDTSDALEQSSKESLSQLITVQECEDTGGEAFATVKDEAYDFDKSTLIGHITDVEWQGVCVYADASKKHDMFLKPIIPECESLKNQDSIDFCYQQYALVSRGQKPENPNVMLCNRIKDFQMRYDCISWLTPEKQRPEYVLAPLSVSPGVWDQASIVTWNSSFRWSGIEMILNQCMCKSYN